MSTKSGGPRSSSAGRGGGAVGDARSIEEQKSQLRLEEVEEQAATCTECTILRRASGDATAYCPAHLKKIYGVY